jgi:hypothetical protein
MNAVHTATQMRRFHLQNARRDLRFAPRTDEASP